VTIVCSVCHESIVADDVNLTTALARCRACHHVFDVRPQVRGEEGPVESSRPLMPQSMAIHVREPAGGAGEAGYRGAYAPSGELVIERAWRSFQAAFLLAFAVIWDGMLLAMYAQNGLASGPGLFGLLHVGVGVGLTYFSLAGVLNTTVIRANPRTISIQHGPVPWPGVKEVSVPAIARLYCDSVTSSGRGKTTTYRLNALLRDGRKLTLLSRLPERDQALFIEDRLEAHLEISKGPVVSELDA
jgi:hypothetical protein